MNLWAQSSGKAVTPVDRFGMLCLVNGTMYFGRPRLVTKQSLKETRIARMKEKAPTLAGSTPRGSSFAMFAALSTILAVAGFYYVMNMYQSSINRPQYNDRIEVDMAPETRESFATATLRKIEESEREAEEQYHQLLEELKSQDLLGDEVPVIPR